MSGIGPYVARPQATRGMLRTELQRLAPGSAVAALVLGLVLILFPTAAGASGPWSITSSPNQGTKANVLEGVSCTSAGTFCKAVGYYTTSGNVERTLIETWNGTSWTVDTSPNVGASTNWLVSVSCLSATWCQAVGFSQSTSSSPQHTLVEFWNGTAWTVHSSPNKGASNNDLYGVWCVSTTSCKAVGPYYNGTYYEALIESWNGTSWTISSAPSVGAKGSVLNTVSCVSATACKAAGDLTNASNITKTLIESWNGTVWSVAPSPNVGTGGNLLFGVSCKTTSSCKAVGNDPNASSVQRTLAESWNGTAWTVASSPDQGVGANFLNRVSCISASSCWAVGGYYNSGGTKRTLTEAWGTSWTIASSPNNGTGDNDLYNVSCVSGPECWAVGYSVVSGVQRTLIEHY